MKISILRIFLPAVLVAFLAACNLTKEVEIDLPDYEKQPVVECYLEPGKPFRLLLTNSSGYFDRFDTSLTEFIKNLLIDSAVVTISHPGGTVTLQNFLFPDLETGKFYNYYSPEIVPETVGAEYVLNIKLKDGSEITGKTPMLKPVKLDSVVVQWSQIQDTLARVITYLTDDQTTVDYYRRLLNYSNLTDSLPEQDFILDDKIYDNGNIQFGTGYELVEGDTVFNTIFRITKDYYDYVKSVQLAVFGNLNPFAQPAQIDGNVSGSANPVGIFTCLVFDRDTTIVKK